VNQAHNLKDAYKNLDPTHPLSPEESAFFVERDHSQRHEMGEELRFMLDAPGRYARFLFTGHRGSGKGTELNRLKQELENDFFVVLYSVTQKLDVRDLEYSDLVFSIGLGIVDTLKQNPALANKTPDNLLKPIIDFFAEIYNEKAFEEKTELGVELKPSILNLLSAFARVGTERSSRTTVRKKISGSLRNLITAIDDLARYVERETKKKVLVIIEDLDKLDEKDARELFYEHGKTLSDIPLHLIYTFPISLRHSQDFMQIGALFKSFDLPNIKTHARDNQPLDTGLKQLKEILTKRVAIGLFDTGALELLAEKSGGLVRHLILLASDATIQANLAKRTKINKQDVETAVAELRAEFSRVLTGDQKTRLKAIQNSKSVDDIQDYQDLLFNLSLLEYRNGEPKPWYDAHPIVQDLL
jgi:AAA ATPase domain